MCTCECVCLCMLVCVRVYDCMLPEHVCLRVYVYVCVRMCVRVRALAHTCVYVFLSNAQVWLMYEYVRACFVCVRAYARKQRLVYGNLVLVCIEF